MNPENSSNPIDVERMVSDWYGRVFAFCRSQLRVCQDAEDAVQETFVRGLRLLDTDRSIQSAGPWLRSVAHHVCIDTIRRKRVRQTVSLNSNDTEQATPSSASHHNVDDQEEQQALVDAIHELEEPLREVLLLHYYNDLTYDEIASWLGVARSTVNERLGKARRLLKTRLVANRCCHEL